MNVVKVYGGLGNQFFQYAFGKALQSMGSQVQYDLSWFSRPSDPPRPYGLDKFRVHMESGSFLPSNRKVHEPAELYYKKNLEYLSMTNTNFFGYWQNIAYLKGVLDSLKFEFLLRKDFYTELYINLREAILGSPSTALHIRRGDYVTIHGHHNLLLEYYQKGLDIIGDKAGTLYIFSDDIPWCKENFGENAVYVDLNEYQSFDLMRLCRHKIIANSTFSWWTAILSDEDDRIIIAPKKWRERVEEQNSIDSEGFVQKNWTRI